MRRRDATTVLPLALLVALVVVYLGCGDDHHGEQSTEQSAPSPSTPSPSGGSTGTTTVGSTASECNFGLLSGDSCSLTCSGVTPYRASLGGSPAAVTLECDMGGTQVSMGGCSTPTAPAVTSVDGLLGPLACAYEPAGTSCVCTGTGDAVGGNCAC